VALKYTHTIAMFILRYYSYVLTIQCRQLHYVIICGYK
jgi:hypothetical protein